MANPRDLMVVRARVGGHDVVEDLSTLSALSGDLPAVEAALAQQVDRFAWWSTLEALAVEQEQDAKDALDALEVDLMELGPDRDPKATVTEMKARVRRRDDWRRLHEGWRAAQRQAAMVRVGRKVCEERKDCLKELAKLLLGEMATGLERGGVRVNPVVADALRRQRERKGG